MKSVQVWKPNTLAAGINLFPLTGWIRESAEIVLNSCAVEKKKVNQQSSVSFLNLKKIVFADTWGEGGDGSKPTICKWTTIPDS